MAHYAVGDIKTAFDAKTLNKGLEKRVFGFRLRNLVITAQRFHGSPTSEERVTIGFLGTELYSIESYITIGGSCMERVDEELKIVNEAFKESKALLQETINDVRSLHDACEVSLSKFLKNIIEYRMSTVRESREMLGQLRDVRKFFLEDDYDKEIARLERLVALCKQLKELKADGTLDALSDSIIKLSLKEPS